MDYESSLNDPLKALGMGVAFVRDKADFSRMRDQNDLYSGIPTRAEKNHLWFLGFNAARKSSI